MYCIVLFTIFQWAAAGKAAAKKHSAAIGADGKVQNVLEMPLKKARPKAVVRNVKKNQQLREEKRTSISLFTSPTASPTTSPTVLYIKLPGGAESDSGTTCEEQGYKTISTIEECQAAGDYLGHSTTVEDKSGSWKTKPNGCTWHPVSENLEFWPDGIEKCGQHTYECICKMQATSTSSCEPTLPVEVEVSGQHLLYMGCYSFPLIRDNSAFGTGTDEPTSYGGDGGELSGGVNASVAAGNRYVAIANNPWRGHRFMFNTTPLVGPDLCAEQCYAGCDSPMDHEHIPCGCADGLNSEICPCLDENGLNHHNGYACPDVRKYALWEIIQ